MEETKQEKSPFFADENFVHEKTLTIDGKDYVFGFKEITGFDKDIIQKAAIHVDAESKKVETLPEIGNLKLLMKCVVKAPFDITEANIKKLKAPLKEKLLECATEVNKVEEKIIKN